jgi:ankyrin repeat protein
LCLGNDRVNPIWEAGLESQRGWKKPTGEDSRKVKEDWIKSKYQWKGFLEVDDPSRNQAERMEHFNCELYDAASQGNLLGVADALAHGGSVEWKNDEGKTPLHACAVSKPEHDEDGEWRGIECAELMIQNGAKMKALDDNHQSPLDCAVIGGAEREMIEFLSARAL